MRFFLFGSIGALHTNPNLPMRVTVFWRAVLCDGPNETSTRARHSPQDTAAILAERTWPVGRISVVCCGESKTLIFCLSVPTLSAFPQVERLAAANLMGEHALEFRKRIIEKSGIAQRLQARVAINSRSLLLVRSGRTAYLLWGFAQSISPLTVG